MTGYTIYRDGSPIGTTPDGSTTTFSDTAVASGTTYTYTVDAFDAADNHSDLSDPASTTTSAAAAPVVLIVEENHSYSSIIGNTTEAPFLNQMASGGLSATRDFELTGGSKPNYIGLTAGQTMKGTSGNYSIDNLFNQMHLAGISEKSYEETMPSPCYTKGTFGTAPAQYVKGHNPAANFTDVTSDVAFCQATLIPAGTGNTASQLVADAQNGRLPAFSFVTPNNCDNMHSCSIGTADAFLRSLVADASTAAGAGRDRDLGRRLERQQHPADRVCARPRVPRHIHAPDEPLQPVGRARGPFRVAAARQRGGRDAVPDPVGRDEGETLQPSHVLGGRWTI